MTCRRLIRILHTTVHATLCVYQSSCWTVSAGGYKHLLPTCTAAINSCVAERLCIGCRSSREKARADIDQLFSQLCDGTSSQRKRSRQSSGNYTVSRDCRVLTSRGNNSKISPSAGSSLINIPLCGNIADNKQLSTANSRGLAIETLDVRFVGKKSTEASDLLKTNSTDVRALQKA